MDGGESGESKKEDKVTSSGRTEIYRVKTDRHRQTDSQTDTHTDRQTDTQTDTQTDRQTHRQTHRQTDKK